MKNEKDRDLSRASTFAGGFDESVHEARTAYLRR
jgi:hypothetical protein